MTIRAVTPGADRTQTLIGHDGTRLRYDTRRRLVIAVELPGGADDRR